MRAPGCALGTRRDIQSACLAFHPCIPPRPHPKNRKLVVSCWHRLVEFKEVTPLSEPQFGGLYAGAHPARSVRMWSHRVNAAQTLLTVSACTPIVPPGSGGVLGEAGEREGKPSRLFYG